MTFWDLLVEAVKMFCIAIVFVQAIMMLGLVIYFKFFFERINRDDIKKDNLILETAREELKRGKDD